MQLCVRVRVRVRMCVCVRARARARARVCVCVCVCACARIRKGCAGESCTRPSLISMSRPSCSIEREAGSSIILASLSLPSNLLSLHL